MATTYEELTQQRPAPAARHRHEDKLTTSIERVTSKVPSGVFLAASLAVIGVSAALALSGRTRQANFIGQWVPTILILGLYNKIVKEQEPD